jgi:hypothetical protein
MVPRRITGILLLALLLAGSQFGAARAQGISPNQVAIYAVDTRAFPTLHVLAAPLQPDGSLLGGLKQGDVHVYEDGVARAAQAVTQIDVPVQVAIVLDASGSINQPGATGQLRRDEAIDAIGELLTTDNWLPRSRAGDWFMTISPTISATTGSGPLPAGDASDGYSVLTAWTHDRNRIYNDVYIYDYAAQTGATPLFAMLVDALDRFDEEPGYEGRPKFLLVLSDGIDQTSTPSVDDVIRRANALNVSVLSVKLGPQDTGQAKDLQRLAGETGGAFTSYTGLPSLAPLYGILRSQRGAYDVSYRSAIAVSGKHSGQLAITAGGLEEMSEAFEVPVTVEPPAVRIVSPATGSTFTRVAAAWNADPATIQPASTALRFAITWPAGQARNWQQADCIVDGVVVDTISNAAPAAGRGGAAPLLLPAPGGTCTWNFSALPAGRHSVSVQVKDELGLTYESDPVMVAIDLVIPARPPVPTPVPTLPEPWLQAPASAAMPLSPINMATLGLLLVLMVLVIYALLRRPRVVEKMAQTLAGEIKDRTEVLFHRPDQARGAANAGAFLVVINADGSDGPQIALSSQSMYIGRDPSRSQITFADLSVSRLHCRIVEEADGAYRIYDEGASSGTYVNDRRVTIAQGHRLERGDIIDLGRVELRFEPATTAEPAAAGGVAVPEGQVATT